MAKFHSPQINPFTVPQVVGDTNIKSQYLFNNYYVEFTPSWWRMAIDNAMNYSNLVYLDMLYSWCLQSSPFLASQIKKRTIPLNKRNFAWVDENGRIDKEMTRLYIDQSTWFRDFIREIALATFYGVRVCTINKDGIVTDFPLRNIDIFNRGLRNMTYEYDSVINAEDYDNLFYFQPNNEQDFKLGMLAPISRAVMEMMNMYNDWAVLAKVYSYPRMTVGYLQDNQEAKDTALNIAKGLDPIS